MGIRNWKRSGSTLLAALVVATVPALAQDVIPRGTDSWRTAGDGTSFTDLSLPAGFLDKNCPAFEGRVVLAGVPIATTPAGAFYDGDTLVERLDDAVFDDKGVARTKIVVRGLHFQGADPLKTACGDWKADVGLARQQTPTVMTIVREGADGGYFTAPISVDVVWTFTRTSDGTARTLSTSNVLTSSERSPWQSGSCAGKAAATTQTALVDSGNQGTPSLKIATATNGFNPGFGPNCRINSGCRGKSIDPSIHCYTPAIASYTPSSSF